jgi:hypothetical protein
MRPNRTAAPIWPRARGLGRSGATREGGAPREAPSDDGSPTVTRIFRARELRGALLRGCVDRYSGRTDHSNMRTAFVLAATLAVLGCANPFMEFYRPAPSVSPMRVLPWSGRVKIVKTGNVERDSEAFRRAGYALLGVASFATGRDPSEGQLIDAARRVRADFVLFEANYAGSTTVALPMTSYQPGRSYNTTTAGMAQVNPGLLGGPTIGYSSQSVTQESGTYATSYVPVTVERHGYLATFWRKEKPRVFGAGVTPLPPELRQSLERNTGVLVKTVTDGSPAFRANILVGDVIVAIGDKLIETSEDYVRIVDFYAGKSCDVHVLRNGEERLLRVKMNRR